MSMVVANCIAAMAVRYAKARIALALSTNDHQQFRHSNLTDLSARDLHNISESYTDVAKVDAFILLESESSILILDSAACSKQRCTHAVLGDYARHHAPLLA